MYMAIICDNVQKQCTYSNMQAVLSITKLIYFINSIPVDCDILTLHAIDIQHHCECKVDYCFHITNPLCKKMRVLPFNLSSIKKTFSPGESEKKLPSLVKNPKNPL